MSRPATSRPVALITGASAGIGRAFAETLAGRGYDLVAVARDTARLDALAKELDAAHGAAVEVLTADLSVGAGIAAVEARVVDEARPIDLLVNNAGFGTVGRFHELPISREISEIGLNVVAVARLTHAALPGMVDARSRWRDQRGVDRRHTSRRRSTRPTARRRRS